MREYCSFQGCKESDGLPFTCSFCGNKYCDTHRLPETHYCVNASKVGNFRGWFNRKFSNVTTGDNRGGYSIDLDGIATTISDMTNKRREIHDVTELEIAEDLNEIAKHHSLDMEQNSYFSHESPNGESLRDRFVRYRKNNSDAKVVNWKNSGENIAISYYNVQLVSRGKLMTNDEISNAVVEGWMNSEGHRKNILEPKFRYIGVGIAARSFSTGAKLYVTQNFA